MLSISFLIIFDFSLMIKVNSSSEIGDKHITALYKLLSLIWIQSIPYIIGQPKTFLGFTSATPKIKTSYSFLGEKND